MGRKKNPRAPVAPGGLTAESPPSEKKPAEPAGHELITSCGVDERKPAAGNYSRKPDEDEAEGLADVLTSLGLLNEALERERIIAVLRSSPLLRPAEVRGEPIEQVVERAERRAARCRQAARAPRRRYRNQEPRKPLILARLAEMPHDRSTIGKVARKYGVSTAYVRRLHAEEKRNKANALLLADGKN